jgi:uncharacterized protein (DUF2236 family)
VTAGGPVQRLGELGTRLALTPLQVLAVLAEPVRADIGRQVRRSLGFGKGPPPQIDTDPATAFLPPGAVARIVHGDLPSMVIGGLSALLLQTLHPLAMAGVAEHSLYAEDPIGRLRRTATFVAATTYGSSQQAKEAIEQVRAVHRRVRGVAPDGRPYSAGDPELVTWIHVAEMSSFLHAAQCYGPAHLDAAECDRYYAETAVVALELGAEWVPRSAAEVEAYFKRMRPELYAGPQAIAARDFLLRGVARRPEDRLTYAVIAAAAVSLLPVWARTELGLPNPPLADALVVTPVAQVMCAALRWAITGAAPADPPPR